MLPIRLGGPVILVCDGALVGVSRVWWDGVRLLVDVIATRPSHKRERQMGSMSFGFGDRPAIVPQTWEGPTLTLGGTELEIVSWHGWNSGQRQLNRDAQWRVRYALQRERAARLGREPIVVTWPSAGIAATTCAAESLRVDDLPTPVKVWQAPVAGTPIGSPLATSDGWALLRSQLQQVMPPFGRPLIDPLVLGRNDHSALVLEDVDGSHAGYVLSFAGYATRVPPVPLGFPLGRHWRRRSWQRRVREDFLERNPKLWVGSSAASLRQRALFTGGTGDRNGFRCRGSTPVGSLPGESMTVVVSWEAFGLEPAAVNFALDGVGEV